MTTVRVALVFAALLLIARPTSAAFLDDAKRQSEGSAKR